VSRHLDFDAPALQASRDVAPLWLCHAPQVRENDAWQTQCDALLQVPLAPDGQLDLAALMQALGSRGLTSVLCEGGGQLAASLLRDQLVDDVILYTAGLALGADALPGLGDLALSHLHLAPRFELISARKIGPDIRQDWRRLP
jgi:diaminohydroxyphosphoribosylaminopyrimidine deaminase/5-amino-6-(5-phosphoribosylamino)uracil reductase